VNPAEISLLADMAGYDSIVVLILVVMVMSTAILLITHFMPKGGRHGPEKDATYESGMEPIGDARRRFNVRFYLVAMLFLLFDVELVFMYPWAVAFARGGGNGPASTTTVGQSFLFAEMGIFFAILLVGYAYAWKKGVFRWD